MPPQWTASMISPSEDLTGAPLLRAFDLLDGADRSRAGDRLAELVAANGSASAPASPVRRS